MAVPTVVKFRKNILRSVSRSERLPQFNGDFSCPNIRFW